MSALPRRIAHLDMDAFYASVELLRYPELRGKAVVIGGRSVDQPTLLEDGSRQFARLRDYSGRGVVTTSTYEARALGVFSAMGIMKAAQLAPDAILLPVDFDSYRHYSRLFKQAVSAIAPQIEDRGIDEIYLDLSSHEEATELLARRIKEAVRAATGLSWSIGVAPNKLLAKICSDLDKPDGLTLLTPADIPTRIWPLPVRKVNGIGPKATARLAALGIDTIAQLAQTDPALLRMHFGRSYSEWLHAAAQGWDDRPVKTSSELKSVSRETTFERDLHAKLDRDTLSGIKLRYADFRTLTRDVTLPAATADAAAIRRAAGECLRRVPLEQKLRLLGVRVSALTRREDAQENHHQVQASLFLPD